VGREGFVKTRGIEVLGGPPRETRQFLLRVEDPEGRAAFEHADVVFDASGVYGQPNATGLAGLPAVGEETARDCIDTHLSPTRSRFRDRYSSRRVLLLGDGHSAATALRLFHDLAESGSAPQRVDWVCRDRSRPTSFEETPDDPLPARRQLAIDANRIARSAAWLSIHPGADVESYELAGDALRVRLSHGGKTLRDLDVDRVLALVGYRPDLAITRELQVHHCYASEGPMKLASAILASGGAGGDCLSQVAHGPESLRNPEPGFFILGAKSYGRNTNFLLSIGHQQIQDVFTHMGEPARSGSPLETAPSTSA
jgi:hypothetical protein